MKNVDEAIETTDQVIAGAVAELTRMAIKPELEPFAERLDSSASELETQVQNLQTVLQSSTAGWSRASGTIEQCVDEILEELPGLQKLVTSVSEQIADEREQLTGRLDEVAAAVEEAATRLGSSEERERLREAAAEVGLATEALTEGLRSNTAALTELVGRLGELEASAVARDARLQAIETTMADTAGELTKFREDLVETSSTSQSRLDEVVTQLSDTASLAERQLDSQKRTTDLVLAGEERMTSLEGLIGRQTALEEVVDSTRSRLTVLIMCVVILALMQSAALLI